MSLQQFNCLQDQTNLALLENKTQFKLSQKGWVCWWNFFFSFSRELLLFKTKTMFK